MTNARAATATDALSIEFQLLMVASRPSRELLRNLVDGGDLTSPCRHRWLHQRTSAVLAASRFSVWYRLASPDEPRAAAVPFFERRPWLVNAESHALLNGEINYTHAPPPERGFVGSDGATPWFRAHSAFGEADRKLAYDLLRQEYAKTPDEMPRSLSEANARDRYWYYDDMAEVAHTWLARPSGVAGLLRWLGLIGTDQEHDCIEMSERTRAIVQRIVSAS